MINILGLFPLTGNGGIASWTKKFLASFPDNNYQITTVNVSPSSDSTKRKNIIYRSLSGIEALIRIYRDAKFILNSRHIDILHTTTSGNIGAFRDWVIANLCKNKGVKTIMHCRYGCITENYHAKNLIGYLTRKSMNKFDQIWVLDSRSYNTLMQKPALEKKVYLTPNSIEIKNKIDDSPKTYKRIAFIGNLIPSKGLYELVEASILTDVRLDIIGPGTDKVINHIKGIAKDKLNKSIFIHGKLPNNEAVRFMQDVDIVALPTYYPSEAFPISILEAMSLTKMVISCPRAAIKDMLTDLEGKPCGILVPPQDVKSIVDAINWCQSHSLEADTMRKKAFEKVYTEYRTEVVYNLYRSCYQKLINS